MIIISVIRRRSDWSQHYHYHYNDWQQHWLLIDALVSIHEHHLSDEQNHCVAGLESLVIDSGLAFTSQTGSHQSNWELSLVVTGGHQTDAAIRRRHFRPQTGSWGAQSGRWWGTGISGGGRGGEGHRGPSWPVREIRSDSCWGHMTWGNTCSTININDFHLILLTSTDIVDSLVETNCSHQQGAPGATERHQGPPAGGHWEMSLTVAKTDNKQKLRFV